MAEGLSADNLLRDVYNPRSLGGLADRLAAAWPDFDREAFLAEVVPGLEGRGLGQRTEIIRDALARHLPEDYPDAVAVLLRALGPELEGTEVPLAAFIVMPQCAFVSKYGTEHFDVSMGAFREMTKRFSAEGDVRTFLEVDYERAMATLERWSRDPNPHVRRLVSEGTRPRLPMAPRIRRFQADPRPVIALLERLRSDPSEYVRRSVANNINDIAKDHPELAVEALARWGRDKGAETTRLLRHASRTLVKQGRPEALALLGYAAAPRVDSALGVRPRRVKAGQVVELVATVASRAASPQALVVDLAVFFRKANGTLAPKVFKWRTLTLPPRGEVRLEKAFRLRDTSGRTIYPGRHVVELRINGKAGARVGFVLVRSSEGERGTRRAGGVGERDSFRGPRRPGRPTRPASSRHAPPR